ncbi:MAG: hypothetical protein CVV27_17265, partial [Candidatus Melainabacteria bacterium HGW-Melainabacteria-1]
DPVQAEALLLQALHESLAREGQLPPRPDWLPGEIPSLVLLLAQLYAGQRRFDELTRLYTRFAAQCRITAFPALAAAAWQALRRSDLAIKAWWACFDPELLPIKADQDWQLNALEGLMQAGLQQQNGFLAMWAARRLREKLPAGQLPGRSYELGEVMRRLEALLNLPPGTWLDRVEFEIQQALARRDIPAVAFFALAYLCEAWDQTVLGDAVRALHLLGAPGLVRVVAELGRDIYPDEALFQSFGREGALSLDPETGMIPGGAYWLKLCQRPRQRPRLSVCMIVRNEAHVLATALASVRELADEIIVVDTGSSDQTMAIATAEPKVRLSQLPWQDDFGAARNACLNLASGDWILVLDADESLCPESLPALQKLIAHAPAGLQLFAPRLISDQGELTTRDWVPRVFQRHPLIRFWGRIHEHPGHAQDPERLPVMPLPQVKIWHTGYLPELIQRQQKYRRLALLEQNLSIQGLPNPYWLYHYGYALMYQIQPPDYAKAFAVLEQSLDENLRFQHRPPVPGWFAAPVRKIELLLLRLLAHWHRDDEIFARYARWRDLIQDPEYHYWHAIACLRQDDPAAAAEGFQRCLQSSETALPQAGYGTWKPLLGLSEVALRTQNWAMGIDAFQHLIASQTPIEAQQLFAEWWQKMEAAN